ncbi:hypothetical protein RBA41_28760 [Massilia sp. CCM 9210]|uniref:hypothetical protein n=1 Tax=Massilia scottii TaxID=3057166 RepID=UPI002796DA80|nr:hypothetical protein [Massilia sp. CCM 9210]MDQ1817304.1 hypothetical protein [Massilia sp. CCM 9210]
MNSFGLNSAAVNGSASRAVFGEALFSATGSLAADATRTQYGGAVATGWAAGEDAGGVRMAMGAAMVRPEFYASAEWVLATTAGAISYAVLTARAAHTEVLFTAAFGFAAGGTTIRPGVAGAAAAFTAHADPLVTIGYAATGISTLSVYAEASVKRSGQGTTERDGYASATSGLTVIATAMRTAMGVAATLASFSASTDSVKIHAGGAIMASTLGILAVGSSDGCRAEFTSSLSAQPTLTHPGQADFASGLRATAVPTVTIQGEAQLVLIVSGCTADARLALQGAADFLLAGTLSADSRLALQGAATMAGLAHLAPAPWVYRMAEAPAYLAGSLIADGVRICMGEAKASMVFGANAEPATNAAVAAPSSRTMHITREIRSTRTPFERRTMRAT